MKKLVLVIALVALLGSALLGLSTSAAQAQAIPVYTLANHGETKLHDLGSYFGVQLAGPYLWQVSIANPDDKTPVVTMLSWHNDTPESSLSAGLFKAVGHGQAQIIAQGFPRCSNSMTRCDVMTGRWFILTILVP